MAYAAGLVGFMWIKVLAPGFSSRKDLATPVRFGLYALAINMVLNLFLVWPLGHAGLALATTLAAFVNAGLLWLRLSRQRVFRSDGNGWVFALRILFAACLMAALLFFCVDNGLWQSLSGLNRVIYLVGWISAGVAVYAVALLLMGLRMRHLLL